jgi:hypothetical protein
MLPRGLKLDEDFYTRQKKVHINLSDLQFQPNNSAVTFYEQYRNLVIARLRKKGDIITWQNNRVLVEDEELSPSLEELVLDNVLGLIDTRLPGHVRSQYCDLLEDSKSLMDYKNDILHKVPTFLDEMRFVFPGIVGNEDDKSAR